MSDDYVRLRRRPLFTPLWLSALAALVVIAFATWLWSTADATTIIVVRHAEKMAGTDPALTTAGKERAQRLAALFGDAAHPGRVDAVYVSGWRRTQETAAPLAARLGITPIVLKDDDPRAIARRLLRENRGHRALIVWHADAIPDIVERLSGERDLPRLGDDEYGTIYIVTVPAIGRATVLRAEY